MGTQDPFPEDNSIPPPVSGKGTLGSQVAMGHSWARGQESVAQGKESWRKDQLAGFQCPILSTTGLLWGEYTDGIC